MRLGNVNQSITAILSGAFSTVAPTYIAAFGQRNQHGSLATTATAIVPAPAQGETETTDLISIYNADSASATITINLLDTGTSYPLCVVTLLTGEVLQYTSAGGFKVLDSSGRLKGTATNAFADGQNLVLGTTTGTQIGTATNQKLGFYGSTPVTQPTSATQAALTDNSGGTANASTGIVANAVKQTIILPLQLSDIANSAAYTTSVPFACTVLSALFRTAKPATTGSKLGTLTISTSAGSVTGGVMNLTSANQNTAGGTVAASAISGANATIAAGGTIIATGSAVTAFIEGDGWVEVTVSDNDLANAIATLAQLPNAIRSALVSEGIIKGS